MIEVHVEKAHVIFTFPLEEVKRYISTYDEEGEIIGELEDLKKATRLASLLVKQQKQEEIFEEFSSLYDIVHLSSPILLGYKLYLLMKPTKIEINEEFLRWEGEASGIWYFTRDKQTRQTSWRFTRKTKYQIFEVKDSTIQAEISLSNSKVPIELPWEELVSLVENYNDLNSDGLISPEIIKFIVLSEELEDLTTKIGELIDTIIVDSKYPPYIRKKLNDYKQTLNVVNWSLIGELQATHFKTYLS